jgi:uncharacterized protein YodC (DUF2158 family)
MADEATIQAGDTVTLKSDGPVMTVGAVEFAAATCIWFVQEMPGNVGRQEVRSANIPLVALKKVVLPAE